MAHCARPIRVARSPLTCIPVVALTAALVVCLPTGSAGAKSPRLRKPGAPTSVTAVVMSNAAVISWEPPSSDGGSPITSYVATPTHGATPCDTEGALTCTLSGLTNFRTYTVHVRAVNALGPGSAGVVKFIPSGCAMPGPGANLADCNLSGRDLSGLDLTGANLSGADLANCNVNGTDFSGANLGGVSSGGLVGTPTALPADWSSVGGYLVGPSAFLKNADLNNATLSGLDLNGADLNHAGLYQADLSGADLTSATFFEASLASANLSNANLTSAYLDLASASSADFSDALLVQAKMEGIDLTGGSLQGADLTGADLDTAQLDSTNLTSAIWQNTVCPDGSNSGQDGGTCANNLG